MQNRRKLFTTGVPVIMIYYKHLFCIMLLSIFHLWPGTCVTSSQAKQVETQNANLRFSFLFEAKPFS